MLKAQKYLDIARKRGEAGKPLNRVYRMLKCEELYLAAYAKIGSNQGATTKGVDPNDTVDGMSLERIRNIIRKLEDGTYKWKPVRRTYRDKPGSKKKRPLGIPTWSDKHLQEVMRMILEAYYEPQFSEHSHGFRPGRGCHTALKEIKREWKGTKWFVELDIKGCFDNIDHDVLLNILKRNIHDERFLKLLKGMLKAGYVENWRYHNTYSGTPQGGIVSPLLANIILNELDKFIEQELVPEYNIGKNRRINPEYTHWQRIRKKSKNLKEKWNWNNAGKEMQKIPSQLPDDPEYKRLRYLRYADDSILGLIGTRQDAENIKNRIGQFTDSIKLEMSEEKTLITHARSGKARFLNYEISTFWENTKITENTNGIKRRSINGNIAFYIPKDVWEKWKDRVMNKRGEAVHRPELMNLSDFDIISTYEAELQGLINYYCMAQNVYKSMTSLRYFWFKSLGKTLANKFNTKTTTIYRKYSGFAADGRQVLMKRIERKDKKPLVAVFGRKPIERNLNIEIKDEISRIHVQRNELVTRLLANTCELCGKDGEVQGHHIRKLKDLKERWKGRKEKPEWVKRMIALRRKTLFVCDECHNEIHAGTYDGKKL